MSPHRFLVRYRIIGTGEEFDLDDNTPDHAYAALFGGRTEIVSATPIDDQEPST